MTEKPKPGPKGAEALAGIEAGMGGLLGALSDALSGMLAAAGKGDMQGGAQGGETTFDTGPDGPLRAAGHVRVRMGGLSPRAAAPGRDPGRPVNPRRGPAAATDAAAPAPDSPPAAGDTSMPDTPRAPRFEIAEEAAAWVLVAELPGVGDDELSIAIDAGRLVIATTGARRYRAEAPAPEGADLGAMQTRLANGILELRIPRQTAPGAA